MNKILVIGGVAAGTTAASQAKKTDPSADVKIIQLENVVSYGACGMPYVFEGIVEKFENLIVRSIKEFEDKYGIKIIQNTEAIKINPYKKIVDAKNILTGKESSFIYDKLIIATGARAVKPPIKGIDGKNIFLLRTFSDGLKLKQDIENKKSCVLIGAGLVGLEMAEAFKKKGLAVTIVEMTDRILPKMINEKFAKIINQHLVENGIVLKLGEKVQEIADFKGKKIVLTNNGKISGDFVLVGVGVRPNSEIAQAAGIKLGVSGAIRVDQHLRTNFKDIFAAGDCAVAINYITGKEYYLPLGTTANKQGRIAGQNAAGKNYMFRGIAGSAITKAFELYIGKTGLSVEEAIREGFDPVEKEIEGITRASYHPEKKPIWINLIVDKRSRRVLGVQVVGSEFVKAKIDEIALALLLEAKIEDIVDFDWCYVPPTSPVWDPLGIAALQTSKTLYR